MDSWKKLFNLVAKNDLQLSGKWRADYANPRLSLTMRAVLTAMHKRLSRELGVSVNFNMFNLKRNRLHQQLFFFCLMRPIHKQNSRICLSPRGSRGICICTLVQNLCWSQWFKTFSSPAALSLMSGSFHPETDAPLVESWICLCLCSASQSTS